MTEREQIFKRYKELKPNDRWWLDIFVSARKQVPPNSPEYDSQKVQDRYQQDLDQCLKLGFTRDELVILLDIDSISPDRWDLPIIKKVLGL